VRSRTWPFTIGLGFLFIVIGSSFLFDGTLSVEAALDHRRERSHLQASGPSPISLSQTNQFTNARSSEDRLWSESQTAGKKDQRTSVGAKPYRTLTLAEPALKQLLRRAPMEFTKEARLSQLTMTLPMPDGTLAKFRVEESPVMAPRLAADHPEIKTYRGQSVDDPAATIRFDVTPAGFHAIVLSPKGTIIVEPASARGPGQTPREYVTYDQHEALQESVPFSCVVSGVEQSVGLLQSKSIRRNGDANLGLSTGTTLRNYRLAISATAEFTQTFGGGTVGGSLSAITTMINAVNAIYERDLAIHLNLVANETSIIFTDSASDGYTSDIVNTLQGQNQTVLDQRIGNSNYDLGMVLDGRTFIGQPGRFIFQGVANYQSVCNNSQKGKAATILRSTEPSTITAIYVAAHELGHLLGALHTFNGTLDDCGPSRFGQVAYEPGSGSTIMGYRGGVLPDGSYFPLCQTEDLRSNDTYFHTSSIEEIVSYTAFSNGSFCGTITNTGNNPPSIDAGPDYTIPAETPFTLTATGSDSEADSLTYCWEEFDLGAQGPPHTDNGNRPIFRSFAPVTTPIRTFPQWSDILSGNSTFGESLPTTNRTMTFRVTARDNHAGGGGINTAAMHLHVFAGGRPFTVTDPRTSTAWTAGTNQTVTWDVASTSSAPINCTNVRILLSVDGGISFPFVLAATAPNNGSAIVSIPNIPTPAARIKVEAGNNIFFNVSLNFTITPNSSLGPTLITEVNTNRALALDTVTFMRGPFTFASSSNFSADHRTRLMLFATGLELMAGEDLSVVTAQIEDSAHRVFPVTIEYAGKVPNYNWLTQVNIRLPDGLATSGDFLLSLSLRGNAGNKVLLEIR
jgi:uncharacterized protein (TIGR03437 family)